MKLFVNGYGKMGRMIENIILSQGYEYAGWSEDVQSVDPALAKDCVCIDFTAPDAFRANYKFLAENFAAVVVGTTGWYDIREQVVEYFKKCGTTMIWASNFSIGVNIFFAAVKYVSALVGKTGAGYSPYIVEMHHCHKKDAPSGTAIMIANSINETLDNRCQYVYDRHSQRKKRDKNEIGIHSVRGGTIVGEHDVIFAGRDEVITLSHHAASREVFAVGSVNAAVFISGRSAGLYDMAALLDSKA